MTLLSTNTLLYQSPLIKTEKNEDEWLIIVPILMSLTAFLF